MADTGPCANKSQAFAARWVLRGNAGEPGFRVSCLAPPSGRSSIFSGPEEMCPQSSKTVLFLVSLVLLAQPFTSGKGREAQIR